VKAVRKIGSITAFLRSYYAYIRDINTHKWFAEWGRSFQREIMDSPVSQVSLVLGAMGITGLILGSMAFLLAHPLFVLYILIVGLVIVVAMTMFSFARIRHFAEGAGTSEEDLDRLLALLLERSWLPEDEIGRALDMERNRVSSLIDQAHEAGWIAEESGAIKIAESMKPIARRKVHSQRMEGG
jgi:uncharacterized membrane protein YedE/YeeE